MDLIKIGKYISEKRKALGLTQKQLAEKIGMSDKSVSKWERGVCLPDVSVYLELCEILGIHINEFLAGEDLKEEHMIKQSEDNLLQVAKESKDRQKHLKKNCPCFGSLHLIFCHSAGNCLSTYSPTAAELYRSVLPGQRRDENCGTSVRNRRNPPVSVLCG